MGTVRSVRAATVIALLASLVAGSGAATAQAQPAAPRDALERGRALSAEDCAFCHGRDGRGVVGTGPALGTDRIQGAGPSLVGTGAPSGDV